MPFGGKILKDKPKKKAEGEHKLSYLEEEFREELKKERDLIFSRSVDFEELYKRLLKFIAERI